MAVEYFAMGVIAYECAFGKRPYHGQNRKEIRDHILAKQVQIKKQELPEGWSKDAQDFINRLIQRKPAARLGVNGPSEVKNHPWLSDINWASLSRKEAVSPFLPP